MTFMFEKLRDVKTPSRSYSHAAAWDFYVPMDLGWETKTLRQGEQLLCPSGIRINLNPNNDQMVADRYYMMFHNKSGNATRGLIVGATIVDPDYQGEIYLHVWNVSYSERVIRAGDKLLQATFHPIILTHLHEIETGQQLFAEASDRGKRGFGSTGRIH